MVRDETRDYWVYEDGGDCLGVIEYSRYLERAKDDPDVYQEGERMVPHDQLKAVEGELGAWREDANYQLACVTDCRRELEVAERERNASLEAQNELRDVLRTTCCSWPAIINSARELVALWEAANKRITELERDWELERSRWRSLQQWSQSETDAGRAEPGESCFATALKRVRTQEKRIAELELERNADNWIDALTLMSAIPRCKDGCGHWRPPLGGEYQNAACAHGYGMYQPKPDGSGFCVDHTRLKP